VGSFFSELEILMNKLITFDSWRRVPEIYGTRRQWLRRGRKVPPKSEPAARMIHTYEPSSDAPSLEEIWVNEPDLCLLIDQEIPLFHISQTVAVNLSPRTQAYLAFEQIFLLPARKNDFIRWNFNKPNPRTPGQLGNWETENDGEFLSESIIRRHINQRAIIGVKSGRKTRFIALDHDFHGKNRQIYLDQAEVLLEHFHGAGWHYQVAAGEIDGMHYLRVYDDPHDLHAVRWMMRQQLRELDAKYPELADRAKTAKMPTFGQMEIYPSSRTGFRLPLCRGRQMLLDRPLPLVKHQRRLVQDVDGYIGWLQNPDRQYMAQEEILTLLWYDLASSKPKDVLKSATSVTKKPVDDGSGLGKMVGCCRQKLTSFWNGAFNPPKSLNQALIVSARIFSFEGLPEHRACNLLEEYVAALPAHAHVCSDRLQQGDHQAIHRCILRSVEQAYDGNKGQADAGISTSKLRQAVACWQRGGFKLSDKSSWNNCWAKYSTLQDISWTADDERDINSYFLPVLGKKCPASALAVAQGIVKMAAVKHSQESGIDYSYWQAFLRDEFGVICGNRNKLHRILLATKELNLLDVHSSAVWFADGRKGFATIYCPGKRVVDRVIIPVPYVPKTP
jgi:hypothetical protein